MLVALSAPPRHGIRPAPSHGIRWNPQKGDLRSKAFKPYLAAGVGPVVASEAGTFLGESESFIGIRSGVTIGGFVGVGADVMLGRRWSIGISVGYNWMADVTNSIGDSRNFSGVDFGVNFGWTWAGAMGSRARLGVG